ncbi:heparinase II/III domain-containing protein [Sinorhizobium fredii]|uniref:heparinase II/III domain-containing protein n=1 Tax=Rhizobium fredii TaxID=380 RepID=UPI003393FF97
MAFSSCLDDRDLLRCEHFSLSGGADSQPIDTTRLHCGLGSVTVEADHVAVVLGASGDGAAISEQLRFTVPEAPQSNGFGLRVRLRGWEKISYIAIGHTEEGIYRHAKATHPLQDEWFDFCIGFRDLAWGWRNGWSTPQERPISDVRFYIKGVPGRNAGFDFSDVWLWQEADQPNLVFGADQPIPTEVVSNLIDYQRACFPDYGRLARDFMKSGRCPLAGNILLDWPVDTPLPPKLHDNGTYQYSWHSQHPAVLLMLLHVDTNDFGPLFAARDLIVDWLERSFDKPDPNVKYAWYDHGVAERTLALVTLYAMGQRHGFDARFMTRLRRAIHGHAQLLASLVFYAGHQPIRYHNHAWFQDLALMTVGLAFPGWACADLWVETALLRATDQFSKLIVRDGDFAVLAENSIGYHLGSQRLVSTIGVFAALSGRETEIPAIARALSTFSSLMRYPDGQRTLAQGDTYRRPNPPEGDPGGCKPYGKREITVLPRAGYAIAKADHAGRPFMLVFLATSLTATHKHADNLSFTLYLDGIEWLIDPSFYSHEYTLPLPAYLRGPLAHNALVLPEADYAITPGIARLWGAEVPGHFSFEGCHEAVPSVTFSRQIEGATDRLELRVTDSLESDTTLLAQARLMFHCGEGVKAAIEGDGLRLSHPASDLSLRIDLPEGCQIALFHGQEEKPIGGVTGLGFLRSGAITTIEVAPPRELGSLAWRLCAL